MPNINADKIMDDDDLIMEESSYYMYHAVSISTLKLLLHF